MMVVLADRFLPDRGVDEDDLIAAAWPAAATSPRC